MKKAIKWIITACACVIGLVLVVLSLSTFRVLSERYPLVTLLVAVVIAGALFYLNIRYHSKGNAEAENQEPPATEPCEPDDIIDKPSVELVNKPMDKGFKKKVVISFVIMLSLIAIMVVYGLYNAKNI